MAKHGWNWLKDYISIHEKILRFYEPYMAIPRTYTYTKLTDYYATLSCERIALNTFSGKQIRVDINKDIELDPHNRNGTRARTEGYSYSANIPAGSTIIRYCSPHPPVRSRPHPQHHAFHHKHDFRQPAGNTIVLLGIDDWPHVGEFLEEAMNL